MNAVLDFHSVDRTLPLLQGISCFKDTYLQFRFDFNKLICSKDSTGASSDYCHIIFHNNGTLPNNSTYYNQLLPRVFPNNTPSAIRETKAVAAITSTREKKEKY